jgi:membrane-associated phospholipid phosphatase
VPRQSPPVARILAACVAAAFASAATAARADVGELRVRPGWNATLTTGAALVAVALASPLAAPADCRVCGAGELDRTVRERLVWRDTVAARHASNVLANGVVPGAALLNSVFSAWHEGEPSAIWEDSLVLLEVAAVSSDINWISKDAVARRRPNVTGDVHGASNRSFFSGHTSIAFALATGAGTVSTMRGYRSAPWVWAVGMTLAAGVGYLRLAGDAHWFTDVAAGAAMGSLSGFAVPWFFHRVRRPRDAELALVPAPGGVALLF